MKLVVQADSIKELNKLLSEDFSYNLYLTFGKMYRSGYVPYFSEWDYYCIKKSLTHQYKPIVSTVGNRNHAQLCNINYVNQYNIVICKLEEQDGNQYEKIIFHVNDKYDVIMINSKQKYEVEIKYIERPQTTADIFTPVKFVYSLLTTPVSIVEDTTSVIKDYNLIFGKLQDTPWIVPQGLKFIKEEHFEDITKEYCVFPVINGNKCTLYLSTLGVFLFYDSNIFTIKDQQVPDSLYGTIISGIWYENNFTGYDIVRVGELDVRKKSLLKRMKYLESVSKQFLICKVVEYFSDNLYYHTNELLSRYNGVIYAPIFANYMNDRTFVYQDISTVSINFNMSKHNKCGFNIVMLRTSSDTFIGTEDLPYEPCIPLSRDDCSFIGNLSNVVFEFRWDGSGFMPYQRAFDNKVSTKEYAINCWRYINNPVDKDALLLYLKTRVA